MPAYKDKKQGTWFASFYYTDWTGKKRKKMTRGFQTKKEALQYETEFKQKGKYVGFTEDNILDSSSANYLASITKTLKTGE